MLKPRAILAALAPIALGAPALAQTNITSANKYSWSENCGYMNWRDANGGTQGVRIRNTFMSGFIWMENVGWVNLGDGTPGGCGEYMNVTGDDFGVNIEADGSLTGLAWGENVGWINFAGGAMATPPQPARLDRAARRLRGYAWGENIGWINLDHADIFVGTTFCRADWNEDGTVNSTDISAFLTTWLASVNASDCTADFDASGTTNSTDISAFLTAWLAGVNGSC